MDAIGRLVGDNRPKHPGSLAPAEAQRDSFSGTRLIAIGASAGGPAALASILGGLPRDFPAAIVIVQHVDPQFVPMMASWLNQQSALSVRIARPGDRPQANTALIAGTNDHLVFTELAVARLHSGTARLLLSAFHRRFLREHGSPLEG